MDMWRLCNLFCALITVAKRKSLFDDRPQEIQQLIFIVKQDISLLNKQIAQLQEVSGHKTHISLRGWYSWASTTMAYWSYSASPRIRIPKSNFVMW